jgi:BASS family bile acid:Na+ symporter
MVEPITGSVDVLATVLGTLQGILVTVFLVATMTAVGLQLTRGDVLETIRSYNLLGRWLLSNVVAIPLFALVLGLLFELSDPVLTGLVLVSVAPGAPFIPRLVLLAGEDSKRALRMTAALTVVAAILVPILATAVLVFLELRRDVSLFRFLVPLVLILVAPIAVGTELRDRRPEFATRITNPLVRIANLSLLGALVAIVALDPGGIIRLLLTLFGTGTLLVIVVFILGTIGIGWLFGGATVEERRVLALASAARNIGIALFIATGAFPETNADAAIVVFIVLMFVVSGGVAYYWGRSRRTGHEVEAE